MPNRATHAKATLMSTAATVGYMVYSRFPTPEMLATIAGFLVSLWINPDLDLNTRFPRKKPYLWPGWILWFPYSRLIGHRSPLSHWPVIGTALRILYVFVFGCLFLWLMNVNIEVISVPVEYFLYGLVISDAIHALLDTLTTLYRRYV